MIYSFFPRTEKADGDNASNMSNPNSEANKKAQDNRADQLNPNNPEFKGDTTAVPVVLDPVKGTVK